MFVNGTCIYKTCCLQPPINSGHALCDESMASAQHVGKPGGEDRQAQVLYSKNMFHTGFAGFWFGFECFLDQTGRVLGKTP